jgi:capsule polysaccharide export protein KpsE/RkpR
MQTQLIEAQGAGQQSAKRCQTLLADYAEVEEQLEAAKQELIVRGRNGGNTAELEAENERLRKELEKARKACVGELE